MKKVRYMILPLLAMLLLNACPAGKPSQPPARLTLLVSGNTMGYLRNCGCQSGQYGGELRRARLLKEVREEALKHRQSDKDRSNAVLTIDIGSSLSGKGYLEQLYSRQVLKSLAHTGYDMLGLGKTDLEFGQEKLLEYLQQVQSMQAEAQAPGLPLCAANLHFEKPTQGPDNSSALNQMIEKYRIIDVGNGYKVGLIHTIDQAITMQAVDNGEQSTAFYGFSISDPAKAAEQVLMQHEKEADFWIFTLADGIEGSTDPQGVANLRDLDLVIGFSGDNPNQAANPQGVVFPYFVKGPILKARDLLKITVSFPADAQEDCSITTQQLAVGANIKGDDYVLQLIDEIFPEIEKEEKEKLAQDENRLQPTYIGQENCVTCHANIVTAMLGTKHQQAYQSLVIRAQEDPEQHNAAMDSNCLRCHVTGYNPATGFNDRHGGWDKLSKDEHFAMISCEACHGPGQYHVQIKSNGRIPEDLQADGRDEHGLQKAGPETCKKCHDAENSPKFDFDTYWSRIRHSLNMSAEDAAALGQGTAASAEGSAH